MKNTSKMGRPSTPEYRKKIMRYSRVEDGLKEMLKGFESDRDKEKILHFLEVLKQ